MRRSVSRYTILHKGKPIAWFRRKADAAELLSQLQWESGLAAYRLVTEPGIVLAASSHASA